VMNDMVDTVKILIPVHNPLIFDGSRFTPITLEQLVNSRGYGKTFLNPSPTYAKMGKYMPRLTMYKRMTKVGVIYQLAAEFSAPKMLFGNNFDELIENDFDALLTALHYTNCSVIGSSNHSLLTPILRLGIRLRTSCFLTTHRARQSSIQWAS
jgi:hypothetical protein